MTGIKLYINRLCIFASQIGSVFVIGNYRGIRDRIPLLNSENKVICLIVDVLIYFVLVVLAASFAALFD